MKTIVWFGFVLAALSAAGKVIVIKPGQSATLECGTTSFTDIVWYRENNLIVRIDGKTGSTRKGKSDIVARSRVKQANLQVSQVKEEDAGKFTCMADGKSQEHTLLVVSISVSPSADLRLGSDATLHCQVKGLNSTVQWKRPDGSAHTGSQTVQLKSVVRSDAGTWQCTFSHDEGSYSQRLNINVEESITPAPIPSQSSEDICKPTCPDWSVFVAQPGVNNPPSDAALLLGLSWWVWVAVGVGGLVVVLLVVVVIVLCKRIKRKKRKLHKMELLKPKHYCQCNCPTAAAKPQQGRRREKPLGPPLQPLLIE